MERKFLVFDSFADAAAHDQSLEQSRTPAQRIMDCYLLSIKGWQFHKGSLPEPRLRHDPLIRTAKLGEES